MSEIDACRAAMRPQTLRISDAARRCFERYGFHAASMARIADAAGMSVGHIYRYFENKEAVVAAIVEQDLEAVMLDIEGFGDSPDEIAGLILAHFERSRSRQKTVLWLEMMAEGARNPKIACMIQTTEARIRERLHEVISNACKGKCEAGDMGDQEIAARMTMIGLLMDGLQVRTFLEENLPAGVMKHVRALLAQTLSPAPITPGAV